MDSCWPQLPTILYKHAPVSLAGSLIFLGWPSEVCPVLRQFRELDSKTLHPWGWWGRGHCLGFIAQPVLALRCQLGNHILPPQPASPLSLRLALLLKQGTKHTAPMFTLPHWAPLYPSRLIQLCRISLISYFCRMSVCGPTRTPPSTCYPFSPNYQDSVNIDFFTLLL